MLARVRLSGFRNYSEKVFEFEGGVNVIFGPNASGKTNLLEAVCLLAMGTSFKARRTEEMIRFGEELGRVEGELTRDEEKEELEVVLTNGLVGGKRSLKHKYFINGAAKRRKDYRGLFAISIFKPEDMSLLTGQPDARRDYLDQILCQVDEGYGRSLSTYNQALRRRNKLLDAVREGLVNRYSLTFWDGLLIKHGQVMAGERQKLVDFINHLWQRSELFNKLKLEYDNSAISEQRLLQYKDEELAAGYTLVGPHKDDIRVMDQGRDLSIYGSRGEQRMVVLAMKLGEIYYLEEKRSDRPLLLLDDILSELDETHKQEVLRVMQQRQVLVTTATKEDLALFEAAKVLELV